MTVPLDLAGKTAAKVEQELRALGFTALRYLGPNGALVTMDSSWRVVSVDGAGSSMTPDSVVTIRVDKPAPPPPPKTTTKVVTPKPAPPKTQPPVAPAPPAGVSYKNCTAAKAAGAAPVYRGQPGYGPHLDRDNDGVGCER